MKRLDSAPVRRRIIYIGLLGVILLAAWLRFSEIATLPPGMHFDLAFNAFDIARLYLSDWRIFFPANTGREPLYIYFQALVTLAFGLTPFALQLTSALIGVVTIPLLYRFTFRLYSSRTIAFLAALFAAISFWHIFYSRLGLRVILLVPFTILCFWMLWEAVTRLEMRFFAATGVALALAQYTYLAARLIPIALAIVFFWALWTDRTNAKVYLRGGAIAALVAILLTLPLGYYFWQNPDEFFSHSAQISLLNPEIGGENPTVALLQNGLALLGMFLFSGDPAVIRNLPGRPVFDPFLGILFVAGTVVWLYTLVAPRSTRIARMRAVLALAWVGVLMVASLFSTGAPSFIRLLAIFPVVMILPAWGADALLKRLHGTARYVGFTGIALVVLLSATSTYRDYFAGFANYPGLYYWFDQDKIEIADWINTNAQSAPVYLAPLLYQQGTIAFLTRNTLFKSFDSRDTLILPPQDHGDAIYYAFPTEQEMRIETLARRLPGGERADLYGPNAAPILLVYRIAQDKVPRSGAALDAVSLSTLREPAVSKDAVWQDGIHLSGMRVEAGGEGKRRLDVTLYLDALQAIQRDYTFSIKVRDANGDVVGQEDKMPGSNSFPTRWWSAGETIIERFYPEFEDCVSDAEYTITLEIYDPATGSVLSLQGVEGNLVTLGTVRAADCVWEASRGSDGDE